MFTFVLILMLITEADQINVVTWKSQGYGTATACEAARQQKLTEISRRSDLNGLMSESCKLDL